MRTPEAPRRSIEASRDDKYMIRVLATRELGWRAAEDGVLAEPSRRRAKDVDYGVREQAVAALSHRRVPRR